MVLGKWCTCGARVCAGEGTAAVVTGEQAGRWPCRHRVTEHVRMDGPSAKVTI